VARPDPALAALGEQVAKGSVAGRRDRYEREVVALIRAVHRLTRRRTYAETTVSEILDEAKLATAIDGAGDAAARFDRWLDWYLSLLSDPRRLSRFIVLQQEHDRLARDHRARMGQLDQRRDAVLVEILALGVTDGSLPGADPARDAPVIHALVTGTLRRVATGEKQDADEVRRRLRRFCDPALRRPAGL
jgi:hypothetical protein